jgi:hypothetical protein
MIVMIASYRDYCAVFMREMGALGPERFELVRQKRREYRHIVQTLIARGIEQGELRDVNVELAAQAFLALHNHVYAWMRHGGPASPEVVAELFDDIFLVGLSRERPSP